MKRKLTLIILAIVMCLAGTAIAVGCGGGGGSSDPVDCHITFYGADGVTELEHMTVKSGQTVNADDVRVEQKTGYSVVWIDSNGVAYDFTKAVQGDMSLTLSYKANDVAYKVEYYTENLEGGEYSVADTQTLSAATDTTATAAQDNLDGFTFDATNQNNVLSGTVAGDGSLVLKLYYTRNSYTVTYVTDGNDNFDSATVKYGATVTATAKKVDAINKTTSNMDEFVYWSATENGEEYNFSTAITGNVTLYAVYETVERKYNMILSEGVGLYTFRDQDNAVIDSASVGAEEDFTFIVKESNEAQGDIVVTAVKINDDGTKGEPVTLTATAGVYTIADVANDYEITVSGLTQILYSVNIMIAEAPYPDEVAWAKALGANSEDIAARVMNYATEGEYTYQTGVINAGVAVLREIPAGEYVVDFGIVSDEGEFIVVGDKSVEFVANYREAEEQVIETGETVSYGAPSVEFLGNNKDNFKMEGGVITGEITKFPEGHLTGTINDFVPGTDDFIATITFEENGTIEESDPMFGLVLIYGDNKEAWASFNRAGMRLRGITGGQYDESNVINMPNMIAKAAGYDKVTYTIARKGDAFYVFLSGSEKSGAVAAVSKKLMAVMTANSITFANGKVVDRAGGYGTAIGDALSGGVKELRFAFQMTNECPFKAYGIGYSKDAEVIDSYLTGNVSTLNENINGETSSTKLYPGESKKYELVLPEGKIIGAITLDGQPVSHEIYVTDEGIVEASFTVSAGFNAATNNLVVTYVDGTLLVAKGKVNTPAKDLTLTLNGVDVYVENGEFTAFVVPATEYVFRAAATGYKTQVVKVTDLSEEVVINVNAKWELTADSIMIGEAIFHGGNPDIMAGGGKSTHVRDVDADGNEIVKSVIGTTKHREAVLYNYVGSRFVSEFTINYDTDTDGWIRIGFSIVHADGTAGNVAMYGRDLGSTKNPNWTTSAVQGLPGTNNVIGKHYIEAGDISVKMYYDNGNVQFYVRNQWMFGDNEWHLYHQGGMIYEGGIQKTIAGPVAVGMFETSNATQEYTISNISIKDLGELNFTESEDYEASLVYEDGKPAIKVALAKYGVGGKELTSLTVGGTSVPVSFDVATSTYYGALNHDVLVAGGDVAVTVVDFRERVTITGNATIGGDKIVGIAVSALGEDGIEYSASTNAEGAWSLELPVGNYNVSYTHEDALTYTAKLNATGENAPISVNLSYGFASGANNKIFKGADMDYDPTSANPYQTLTITTFVQNADVPFAQPIAENAVWGFTIDYADNFSRNGDVYYDEDAYFKAMIFDTAEKNLGLNAIGGPWGGTAVASQNIFSAAYNSQNLKDLATAGIAPTIDVRYVRSGATVSLYARIVDGYDAYTPVTSEREFVEISKRTDVAATGDVNFYYTYSSRSGNYANFTFKNFYYFEGAAEQKSNLTVSNPANATLTLDKATAGQNEKVTVSFQAESGYTVSQIYANGKPVWNVDYVTPSTKGSASYYAPGFGDVVFTAKVVPTGEFKQVMGRFTFKYDVNKEDFEDNNNAKAFFVGEDGTHYAAQVMSGTAMGQNVPLIAMGKVPAGNYTMYAATPAVRTPDIALDVTGNTNVTGELGQPLPGFWTKVTGNGLVPTPDGGLSWKYHGGTQETEVAGAEFCPFVQTLEFGYTLTGMNAEECNPFLGMFIRSSDTNIVRVVFKGAGDQMMLMCKDDYSSRLDLLDSENWTFFGSRCNLNSDGAVVAGAPKNYNWQNSKDYVTDPERGYKLSVKFVWDGYKFTLYAQTGELDRLAPGEWSKINEVPFDVSARYTDKKADYVQYLYKTMQPCTFGITARLDAKIDGKNTPKFSDIWYKVYDKAGSGRPMFG